MMMKRLTLALGISAGLLSGSLYAAEVTVKTDQKSTTEVKSGQQCSAKHLLGARVNDSQGQKLGEIEDLVLDPASSRVQFAVVKLSGDLAKGTKIYTPIPIAALRPDPAQASATAMPGTFMLTVDRSKLLSASHFNVERWPVDQTKTYVMWGPEVYSHYGMSWNATAATGAPGSEVYVQQGTTSSNIYINDAEPGLEHKENVRPPTDFRQKSVDNGSAPDGKGTFPFLHEATDQD
jgi:sporulation protein YlmC with PRC-barrel domain